MSVLKETAAAVVGVCALILACDGVFGVGEARFNDDYYRASFYASRWKEPTEFRFARNITPAARVSDAFAQFTPGEARPGEARHGRHYSSLPTLIR